jgi:hypothetical protein
MGAGALAACVAPSRAAASAIREIPTADELAAAPLVERCGLGKLARIERLGRSRGGREIDLISIGAGPRSALIVGAPHPNEPIGCLTVTRMLARLAVDRRLRDASGYRWNFIPAMDIDGIALNQGWFRRPLTLESYLRDFYRPSFDAQAEYCFPLDLDGYRFDTPSPENRCWQRALEISRPTLQCSLHGADSGGSFYVISRDDRRLADLLAAQPAAFGIDLNPIGEPFAEMAPYRQGVTSFPAISPMIEQAVRSGEDPKDVWNAGDSSAGYAARRYGTFSMTCEVPLWDDARLRDPRPSPYTLADVLDQEIAQSREDAHLLEGALPALRGRSSGFEADALLAALEAALTEARAQPAELEKLKAAQHVRAKVSYRDLVEYEPGTAALRTPAMLVRLARIENASAVAADAGNVLSRRLAVQFRAGPLVPIALERSTSLQMSSILAAAAYLRDPTAKASNESASSG